SIQVPEYNRVACVIICADIQRTQGPLFRWSSSFPETDQCRCVSFPQMRRRGGKMPTVSRSILWAVCLVAGSLAVLAWAQTPANRPQRDAVAEAQQASPVKAMRPEQQKSPHDSSDVFDPSHASASSPVFQTQPKQGKVSGFDFARDP